MTRLGAVWLMLVSCAAFGADVTVSWTHPVQFVDGTPLALNQIASTRVERGTCNSGAFGTKQGEQVVAAPATSVVFSNLAPGNYAFRAYTKATTAAGGGESVASTVACKSIPFPDPGPPTIVTVTTAVHDLKPNGKINVVVGTVPLGTACGPRIITTQGQRKYYELSYSDVSLTKIPASVLIVGQCAPS